QDLGELIDKVGPLPLERVVHLCVQVCGSVEEAHSKGIVHRDLKPENVMVAYAPPDTVKVLDFGLAKLLDHDSSLRVTRAGTIVGTPYYMAPEHIRGQAVDRRSDIYALGAVLYKALTGHPPFRAPTPMGILTKHLTESADP